MIKSKYLPGMENTEADVKDQGKSQTKHSSSYKFNVHDPKTKRRYEVTLMDTPGVGDVDGLEQDDQNLEDILQAIANERDINAILVMLNGAEPRLNARVRYIMTKLQGMVPDYAIKSIIFLLTNVQLKPTLDI